MRIAFRAAPTPEAQRALVELRAAYPAAVGPDEADVIVPLGGDGFMLETLHAYIDRRVPMYGMNLGTVGFLLNEYREDGLLERLALADSAPLHPLRMRAVCQGGRVWRGLRALYRADAQSVGGGFDDHQHGVCRCRGTCC